MYAISFVLVLLALWIIRRGFGFLAKDWRGAIPLFIFGGLLLAAAGGLAQHSMHFPPDW